MSARDPSRCVLDGGSGSYVQSDTPTFAADLAHQGASSHRVDCIHPQDIVARPQTALRVGKSVELDHSPTAVGSINNIQATHDRSHVRNQLPELSPGHESPAAIRNTELSTLSSEIFGQYAKNPSHMADLEAQCGTFRTPALTRLSHHLPRQMTDQSSCRSFEDDYDEHAALYDFAEELRMEEPAAEPWFLEMSRLRRIYILWLNKRLSLCRKSILGRKKASDDDVKVLGEVLHLQGKKF
jgi:hypothetical protein